jgi:hypothetical protein
MSYVRFHRKQHTYFVAYISVTYSNLYGDGGLGDVEPKFTFDKQPCREQNFYCCQYTIFLDFPLPKTRTNIYCDYDAKQLITTAL